MVARLIHLNGPPGVGKSALARRFAAAHPTTLRLDPEEWRGFLGQDPVGDPVATEAVRDALLAAAAGYLAHGRDVVMPDQISSVPDLDRCYRAAEAAGAQFWSVLLIDDVEVLVERCRARQAEGHRPIITPMQIAEQRADLLAMATVKGLPIIQHDRLTNADDLHTLLEGAPRATA